MQENYIALFFAPIQEKALQIIDQAEPVIDRAATYIKNGKPFPQRDISFKDYVSSGMVNLSFLFGLA